MAQLARDAEVQLAAFQHALEGDGGVAQRAVGDGDGLSGDADRLDEAVAALRS
jgi:hypothetical protein